MRLSKQHKVYGAVLGLAMAALGADRFLFTAPADDASVVEAVVVERTPQKRVAAADVKPGAGADGGVADRRAIADRLDEVAQAAGYNLEAVSDAFTPSPVWVKPVEAAPAAVVAVAPVTKSQDAERARQFAQAHRLTAVMNGGRQGLAVVNGKPLRPGEVLDGFTLVSLTASPRDGAHKATFQRGAERIELRLNVAASPAAATLAQAD
jgi:hypothetical protein